jgi:hypothetical protein
MKNPMQTSASVSFQFGVLSVHEIRCVSFPFSFTESVAKRNRTISLKIPRNLSQPTDEIPEDLSFCRGHPNLLVAEYGQVGAEYGCSAHRDYCLKV